jgi:hypothetical protein
MYPVGFEPAVPTSEGPQTHALDREATKTDAIQFSIESCIIMKSVTIYENFTCMLCIYAHLKFICPYSKKNDHVDM